MIEDSSHFEGEPKKLGALVAGAYLAAAGAIRTFNNFALCDLANEVEKMTPADAERSLQVYAQERVVETLTQFVKPNETCSHDNEVWYCDGCLYEKQLRQKSILEAATARLAELSQPAVVRKDTQSDIGSWARQGLPKGHPEK